MTNEKTEKTESVEQHPVFIDLRNDVAFKYVFCTLGHEDELLLLVNCILPEKNIVSVELSTQEQVGDSANERRGIYDISCKTGTGEYIEIEMQYGKQLNFGDRMVYYSSFMVRNLVGKFHTYDYSFPQIYMIGILNFILPDIPSSERLINSYSIRNDRYRDEMLTDHLHYITVELPKFQKPMEQLDTPMDYMAYIFNNQSQWTEIPQQLRGKGFDKLFEMSKFAAMKEEDRMSYIARQKEIMDHAASMYCATREGLEQGLEKGRAEGRQEGLSQGIIEGKRAMATTMVKALKEQGVPIETIAICSGLSLDEIKAL